ncbi:MAG: hypothetical protein EAX96_20630 [Candidatus Lokiarchaeota archaeon]|nr:hypothetical protein [Candidatus Lokiarchaeota archaeon]
MVKGTQNSRKILISSILIFVFILSFSITGFINGFVPILQNNPKNIDEKVDVKIDPLITKEWETNPNSNLKVIVVFTDLNDYFDEFRYKYSELVNIIVKYTFISSITIETSFNVIKSISLEEYVEFIWLDKQVTIPQVSNPQEYSESICLSSNSLIGNVNGTGGYNGSNVIVAVLDTGIDPFHPDLGDISQYTSIGLEDLFQNINYSMLSDLKIIGHVNFADLNPYPIDINGHGTYVAGIIAGTNGTGVAPGAYLFNVKVLSDLGIGYWSWIIAGIDWSLSHGADIITLAFDTQAFGLPGLPTDPLNLAINEAVESGIIVIAAAGDYPQSYLSIGSPGMALGAITVGAYNNMSGIPIAWENSSRGPTLDFFVKPDILAPGINITSTISTLNNLPLNFSEFVDFATYGTNLGNNYSVANGTTGAAAYVAGAVALLIEQNQYLDPNTIKIILHETSDNLVTGDYNYQGAGMINLTRAQQYLRENNMVANLTENRVFTPFLPYDGYVQSENAQRNLSMFVSNYGSHVMLTNFTSTENTSHLLLGFYALEYNDTLTWFSEGEILREFHDLTAENGNSSGLGVLKVGPFYIIVKEDAWEDIDGFRNTLTIINQDSANYSVILHSLWHTDLFLNNQEDNDSTYIPQNDVIFINDTEIGNNFFFGMNATTSSIANSFSNQSYYEDVSNPLMSAFKNLSMAMSWNLTENGILGANEKAMINISLSMGNSTSCLLQNINLTQSKGFGNPKGDIALLKVENLFRTEKVGNVITTQCLVMNLGSLTLDDVDVALMLHRTREDEQFITIDVLQLYTMEPGEFQWVNFSYVPLEASSYEIFWVAGSEDAISEYFLSTAFLEEFLNISISLENESYPLDNFITRNIFINNGSKPTFMPMSLIFPIKIPDSPFLIKFPTDFSLINFSFFTNTPLQNINMELESENKSILENFITLPTAFNLTYFDTRPVTTMIPTFPIAGKYVGKIIVKSNEIILNNITVDFEITYPKGRFLFYKPNVEFNISGLSEFNDFNLENASDLLLAFNERLETIYGEYFELYNLCVSEGFDIDDFSVAKLMGQSIELNDTLLSLLDAVLLIDPIVNLTSSEVDNLTRFVEQNNSLIVIMNENSKSTEQINNITERYGYSLNTTIDQTKILSTSNLNSSDPLLKGVSDLSLTSFWIFNDSQVNRTMVWNDAPDEIIIGYNKTNSYQNETFGQLLVIGDSDFLKNEHVFKEDNYILLNNTIHWAISNTLSMEVFTYSEREDNRYYVNDLFITFEIHVQDKQLNNISDLQIFAIFILPNGSLFYFLAFHVVDGWYTSAYLGQWSDQEGIYSVVFVTNSTDYAISFGHVTFEMGPSALRPDRTPNPTIPESEFLIILTVYITSTAIFAAIVGFFYFNRNRWHKKLEAIELKEESKREIGNILSSFQAFLIESEQIIKDKKMDEEEKLYFLKQMKDRYDFLMKKSKKY